MTNIREELARKLDKLSPEQLNSVRQFVEFLEYQQQSLTTETPITNEDIDRIVESYRQEIYDLNNELFLSFVSIGECVIKLIFFH